VVVGRGDDGQLGSAHGSYRPVPAKARSSIVAGIGGLLRAADGILTGVEAPLDLGDEVAVAVLGGGQLFELGRALGRAKVGVVVALIS
jgi:hypothetical protein